MKKILFTAMAAVALFAMTACNNNKAAEATDDTCAVAEEQCCEHQCAMDSTCAHECMCGDECKAANCENCPNHGTENCCKAKAAVEGQACCENAGEKKCEKACEKKCEGEKACEHKCDKAK